MHTFQFANGIVSLLGAILLTFIVLNPHIKEGGLIKIGLILMIFAMWGTAVHALGQTDDWQALWAAGFTLRLGLLVVGAGFIMRRWKKGSWEAAMSGWGDIR